MLMRRLSTTSLLLALLAILLVLTFAPSFWTVRNLLFGHSDRWAYFAPMSYYLDVTLQQGHFPLWNPLVSCGTPFAADPQTSLFYPFQLLRSLLTFGPTPYKTFVGLALLVILHALLAGLGTYILARSCRLSHIASFTSAMGFMLSAAMVRRIPDVNLFVYIVAWLPFLLLFLRKILLTRNSSRMGFPQFLIYTGVACAGYALLIRLVHIRKTTLPGLFRQCRNDVIALLAVVVLGMLLAATMWIPAAEFAGISARSKEIGASYTYTAFVVSPLYLLRGLIEYPGVTWVGSCGIRMAGAGLFLLAMASLWHPRRRETIPLAVMFLIFLDCSLAPQFPIGRFLSWIAPFRIDVPARASLFACFFGVLLSGFGLDAIFHPRHATLFRRTRFILIFGMLLVLGVLWNWTIHAPYLPVSPWVWIFPAMLAVSLVLGSFSKSNWLRMAVPMLVFCEILLWNQYYIPRIIEILPYPGQAKGFHENHTLPLSNARQMTPDVVENGFLRENQAMFFLQPSMGGYNPLYIAQVRQTLCSPENETYYTRELPVQEVTTSTTRGFLLAKRRFWLAKQYVNGPLPGKSDLFPPTTTVFLTNLGFLDFPEIKRDEVPRHAVSDDSVTSMIPVSEIQPLTVNSTNAIAEGYEYRYLLPEIQPGGRHAALRLVCAASKPTTLQITFGDKQSGLTAWGPTRLLSGGDKTDSVEIPMPDAQELETMLRFVSKESGNIIQIQAASVVLDTADENHRIAITLAEPNRVRLTVSDLPASRMLTFVESAYPGWTAMVDGRSVPIYAASGGFQAILLEKGTHSIQFTFQSPKVAYGLGACCAGLLVVLGGWYRCRPPCIHPE